MSIDTPSPPAGIDPREAGLPTASVREASDPEPPGLQDPGRWMSGWWWHAVERGGRGQGAAARTALRDLHRAATRSGEFAVASLALSTVASLYRQSGRHAQARAIDGRALSVLDLETAAGQGGWGRAAAADALVGLAADNLGLCRFGATRRLLDRAGAVLDRTPGSQDWTTGDRCRLRWHWVNTELGLYGGDSGRAREHAGAATALLDAVGAAAGERHRIKTALIGAAVTAADDPAGIATAALDLADRAADAGLVPLEWAALALRRGVGDESAATGDRMSDRHRVLVERGMPFAPAGRGGPAAVNTHLRGDSR